MKVVKSIEEINPAKPCAVALGNFDGVHLGHMRVIHEAVNADGLLPAVFTFQGNPHGSPAIMLPEDKERVIADTGADLLISIGFDTVQKLPADEFFYSILLEKCRAKKLCCGDDFRFGINASGDVMLLQQLCRENNVELKIIPTVKIDGQRISSTAIRKALELGDVKTANDMLGRPFGFSLEVVQGNRIGRNLGAPTINQTLPKGFVLPKFGVYASLAYVGDTKYYGVTNIGVKPTVGSNHVLSETWMPEFSGDLYGKKIYIAILGFIRAERKFDSLDSLKKEILINARQAREIVFSHRL